MEIILFLDDVREPKSVSLPENFKKYPILKASSYEQAVNILNNDKYQVVGFSLDYDLYFNYQEQKSGLILLAEFDSEKKNGIDFLNCLILYNKENNVNFKEGFYIHSQNIVKAKEMKRKIINFFGKKYLVEI